MLPAANAFSAWVASGGGEKKKEVGRKSEEKEIYARGLAVHALKELRADAYPANSTLRTQSTGTPSTA